MHIRDDEEEDYVYDNFLLDKDMPDYNERDTTPCVELRGGIGYWEELNDFILEAMKARVFKSIQSP